jgi:hypothetical protein
MACESLASTRRDSSGLPSGFSIKVTPISGTLSSIIQPSPSMALALVSWEKTGQCAFTRSEVLYEASATYHWAFRGNSYGFTASESRM